MERRQDKSRRRTRLLPDDRREHLIRVAVQLFATEGVAATKILHVTEAAGVSNGTFYHYFANKNELQAAVGELVVHDLVKRLATAQEARGYRERIALGAFGTMTAIASEPELGAIMTQYLENPLDAPGRSPVNVDHDVQAGQQAGEFAVDAPVPLLVSLLVATLAVGARQVLGGGDPAVIGEIIAGAHLRLLGVPDEEARVVVTEAAHTFRIGSVGDPAAKVRLQTQAAPAGRSAGLANRE